MSEDELNKKVDIILKELLTIIKFEMLKEPSAIVHRPNLPEQIVTNAYIDEHYPKDTSPEEIDNEYETFRRIGIAKTEAERTQKFLRTNNAEFLIEDDDDFF